MDSKQLKIKVCGMRNPDNIKAVDALHPDFMGFIFYPSSPRYIAPGTILPDTKARRVGVFVNASMEEIIKTTREHGIPAVQLHGNETSWFCCDLTDLGYQVIKAFRIDNDVNIDEISSYQGCCEYFLYDTKSAQTGGTGIKFDWEILKKLDAFGPFFLSGGISLADAEIIKNLNCNNLIGIDLNSRFEIEPALKDADKLEEFIKHFKQPKADSNYDYISYQVDNKGYYGPFGGAYIPEMLYPNVKHLADNYLKIIESESFKQEFKSLLKDYVGRPSPLYFSKRMSDKYGFNIYLKREDLNHTGSHKINNTIGQILIARYLGKKRIIAETGAGQHGVATATVCARAGLECIVFMGATDVARQMPNVEKMQMLGATVVPVQSGNKTLKDATNEAIRDWINHPDETHYIIGSVVGPHPYPDMVARFQSIISEEMKWQLKEQTGKANPDAVIACVGGGSNAAGAFYHYLNEENVRLIAVEADGKGLETGETAATIAAGKPGIIHGSMTLLMQTDDGQIVEPYSISAGLDYPGIGPIHANLHRTGRAEFIRATDQEALDAAFELTLMEGIIPALESAHGLAALSKGSFKPGDTVVVNISGRGDKDMEAYRAEMKRRNQQQTKGKQATDSQSDLHQATYSVPKNANPDKNDPVSGLFVP